MGGFNDYCQDIQENPHEFHEILRQEDKQPKNPHLCLEHLAQNGPKHCRHSPISPV
jgi:hypothetical protein